MKKKRRRTCRNCGVLYHPDPRTRDRQKHCSAPACKRASRAWRQMRWLSKKANRDYFRGPENTERVRQWRKDHPDYARQKGPKSEKPLQDDSSPQPTDNQGVKPDLNLPVLQDDLLMQPAVVLGLISTLTDSAQQDDIVQNIRRAIDRRCLLVRDGRRCSSRFKDSGGGEALHGCRSGTLHV